MTKVKLLTLVAVALGGVVTLLFLALRALNKGLAAVQEDEWSELEEDSVVVKDLPDNLPQDVEGFVPAARPREWRQDNDSDL